MKAFHAILLLFASLHSPAASAAMPRIAVSQDSRGFVLAGTQQPFVPWGVNYDHDETGRLLEDYWSEEWPKVAEDFGEIKQLGANVVRVHLQFGKFMETAEKPNAAALAQLERLVKLAEETRLYLDVTGLGCYHKDEVPKWYDEMDEAARWQAQAVFWRAVAEVCAKSPAIFCYDLMNEPVSPGGDKPGQDWLPGEAFGGKHFVQYISLDRRGRPRHEIARQWIEKLVAAIRTKDQQHLITVGLVPWSLERPGLQSGFVPKHIHEKLDFIAVHLYPESDKQADALDTLRGFDVGKPVVIEEMFPLKCSSEEMREFILASKPHAAGWISFYWGIPPERIRADSLREVLIADWLKTFVAMSKEMAKP